MLNIAGQTIPGGMSTSNAKTSSVTLSDGRVIAVIPQSTTKFGIYELAARPSTSWTTRGTPTVTAMDSNYVYSVELGHDESYIVVSYYCNNGDIRTIQITIASWAVAAEVLISNAGSGTESLDMSISQTGCVMVAALRNTGSSVTLLVRMRATTGGAWVTAYTTNYSAGGSVSTNTLDVAVAWRQGVANTARRFVVSVSYLGILIDPGVHLINGSINETSGASPSIVEVPAIPYAKLPTGWFALFVTYSSCPRRTYLFTDSNDGRVYMATVTRDGSSKTKHMVGLSMLKTVGANAAADVMTFSGNESSLDGPMARYSVASFGENESARPVINFLTYNTDVIQSNVFTVLSVNTLSGSVEGSIQSGGDWDYTSTNPRPLLIMNSDHVPGSVWAKKHDVIMINQSGVGYLSNAPTLTVADVDPNAGETVASSTPTMVMRVNTPAWKRKPPSFKSRFEVATNVGFTTGLAGYTDPVTRTFSTYSATQPTAVSIAWGGSPIASGAWFLRGRVFDVYGNASAYFSNAAAFTITHPMMASNILPAYSTNPAQASVMPYSDPNALGYSLIPISWLPVDAWSGDHQTAARVILTDTTTASVISDTGKTPTAVNNILAQLPVANKGHFVTLSVELWDAYDQSVAPGGPTQYGSFIAYDTPVVTTLVITTIDGDGFVNSAAPVFNYAITPSIYPTVRLDVEIKTGDTVVFTGGVDNPGTAGSFSTVLGVLDADKNYTATFYARDSFGLTGSKSVSFTTKWTAPIAPSGTAVDTEFYNIENQSYIRVSWSNLNQEVDFVRWNVYRRVDQVDEFGDPVEFGDLELIASDYSSDPTHIYKDYFAPSGARIGYKITQVVSRFGTLVESANQGLVFVNPVSEGYWLIDPTPEDAEAASFQLHLVTQDSYSDDYEEEFIQVLGKGRHQDRGDHLGITGSMTCQFRHTGNTTARQKKLRIENIKKEARSLFLRTPFGDVWFVAIGSINISRIAGVGLSEFCDVTIPYSEVYE